MRRHEIVTLKEHIDDIGNRLRNEEFPNEQAVRQGIIDRLLINLGWPTYDTQIVYPEYTVGTGKVDYALCDPQSKNPRVFIEAKQVGNIEGAEEQLFGYDSRIRVPIAVLTDGQKWRFFHPTGEGTWEERKVRELDFLAMDSEECTECFNKYLNYESIRSDEAVNAIKEDYENLVRQRKIEGGLPEAWRMLVQGADEGLVKVVAEKTESLCGHRPDNEQVIAFLKKEELPLVQPNRPEPHKDRPKQLDLPVEALQEYTWKNKPLIPNIAQSLIVELFSGKGETRKKTIVSDVTQTHLERGGLPPNTEHVDQLFAGALKNLKNKKAAKNIRRGYWEIYQLSQNT